MVIIPWLCWRCKPTGDQRD